MTCMAVPLDIRKENPNAHNLGELAYLLGSWQSVDQFHFFENSQKNGG